MAKILEIKSEREMNAVKRGLEQFIDYWEEMQEWSVQKYGDECPMWRADINAAKELLVKLASLEDK